MEEKVVLPWIEVNQLMNDDYRKLVVDLAVSHYPKAEKDLQIFTRRIFNNSGEIRGFRVVMKAPIKRVQQFLVKKFKEDPAVATAIICLWADAEKSSIQTFRTASENAGIHFLSDWDWHDASQGYLAYDDIPELFQFCEFYTVSLKSPEKDNSYLSTLWLSRAVIIEKKGDQEIETIIGSSSVNNGKEISMIKEETPVDKPVNRPGVKTPPGGEIEVEQVIPTVEVEAHIQESLEQKSHDENPDEFPVTLGAVETGLQAHLEKINQIQQKTLANIQKLSSDASKGEINQLRPMVKVVEENVTNWQEDSAGLATFLQGTAGVIKTELEVRSDLPLDEPGKLYLSQVFAKGHLPAELSSALRTIILEIHLYDEKKEHLLNQISKVNLTISKLLDEAAIWEIDDDTKRDTALKGEQDYSEQTLVLLKAVLKGKQVECEAIKKRIVHFRELSQARIKNLVNQLVELEVPIESPAIGEYSLESLNDDNFSDLDSHKLHEIEIGLNRLLDERLAEEKSIATSTLASELNQSWNETKLPDLLAGLAKEKRYAEALLILMAANSQHPPSNPYILSKEIVWSFFNGLEQLSPNSQPFTLLCNVAPKFIQGWDTADQASKAELCLLMLAARHGGEYHIPADVLWQISYDWPVEGMDSWNKVWQAEISDEVLKISLGVPEGYKVRLDQSRLSANQLFASEHGSYVRSKLIKNHHHRMMVNNELMPKLKTQLDYIHQAEEGLRKADQDQLPNLINKLDFFMNGKFSQVTNSVFEVYEREISSEEVENDGLSTPAWRTLNECVDSIREYGCTLIEYWQVVAQSPSEISSESLNSELIKLGQISHLARIAAEQVIKTAGVKLPDWLPGEGESQAILQIEHTILNESTYTVRLPRLVGYLTKSRLDWNKVLPLLLQDLAEPLDHTGIAAHLIEQEAPNQALSITQYIPLELQKRILQLKLRLEKETELLSEELFQLGEAADDLLEYRNQGRWQLVRKDLKRRIGVRKELIEHQKQQNADRTKQIRTAITTLDDEIFELKDEIPAEVYQIVEDGLILAKKVCGRDENVRPIQAYIDEIRYRLEHDSWPVNELQQANDDLHDLVVGGGISPELDLTNQKVLDYFEQGEFKALGLSPTDIPASSIGTRIDLLKNWLTLRKTSNFLYADMKVVERSAVHQLFRSFAKMMAMKRSIDPQGQPIEYETPVIYGYFDLQYPKTAILGNHCIFVALPGDPPKPENINQLELILDDKEWLDYFFVFVFAPGCTPKIRNRLQTSYHKKGLVIIDDPTLLQIVLAEKFERNPVGKLRPLMLNALEADNVDVFKINQLVDSYSSIFVGRDREVERFASREGNYAIYGGRRIGKSSVLKAVEKLLLYRGVSVVYYSFEGEGNCSDDQSAVMLSQLLHLEMPVQGCSDLKLALQTYMDVDSNRNFVILLDEIDRYIAVNQKRHVLIETLRSLSERYGSRFRTVISGFEGLYRCLNGRGPYSPASDPWRRMLNDIGPLENLRPSKAEEIVKEGFLDILGWKFESRAIPQRIVEMTGGHPAFVQDFCLKLQQRVGIRGDRFVKFDDLHAVFSDKDPELSFISYVRKTLEMNLDPVGHYLILLLSLESLEKKGFTFDEIRAYASTDKAIIPDELLEESLERLKVTSVIKEVASRVYEFSVPDYPSILIELGESAHMERLEHELEEYLMGGASGQG